MSHTVSLITGLGYIAGGASKESRKGADRNGLSRYDRMSSPLPIKTGASRAILAAGLVVVLALLCAPAALANSVIDQYQEQVPPPSKPSGSGGGMTLAPATASPAESARKRRAKRASEKALSSERQSVPAAVTAPDGGLFASFFAGLGPGLPIALGLSLLAAAALGVYRGRARRSA